MTFTQTVLYGGNINEAYAETRINIYGNQKAKNSMRLPPDLDCATQVIVRAHYQCHYCLHCLVDLILLGQRGDQFPSLLATKPGSRKRKKVNSCEGDVKGECNVKKSKTLNHAKRRYKKRTTTIRIKKNQFLFH